MPRPCCSARIVHAEFNSTDTNAALWPFRIVRAFTSLDIFQSVVGSLIDLPGGQYRA